MYLWLFSGFTRNKRSISIDHRQTAGQLSPEGALNIIWIVLAELLPDLEGNATAPAGADRIDLLHHESVQDW